MKDDNRKLISEDGRALSSPYETWTDTKIRGKFEAIWLASVNRYLDYQGSKKAALKLLPAAVVSSYQGHYHAFWNILSGANFSIKGISEPRAYFLASPVLKEVRENSLVVTGAVNVSNFIKAVERVVVKDILNHVPADQSYRFAICAPVDTFIRNTVKQVEISYRKKLNLAPPTKWVSEFRLYELIDAKVKTKVEYQARPKWLHGQSFDIYIPKLNVAIEYQGAQHFMPVAFFGGEQGYKNTVERDRIKAAKCKKNKCTLITVEEGYCIKEVMKQIKQAA